MFPSPREFIQHILDEIDYILSQTKQTDLATFKNDPTLQRAFVRSLEIIGEASKQIPEDVRKLQNDIQWRKVAGMRDKLIHGYFGVDYTIVWDVAVNNLPALQASFDELLKRITDR